MTLNISRTYFGGVLNRQGIASSSGVAACLTLTSSLPSRRYATVNAALTKKGSVTAKGTRKDAHNKPTTPKKSAPKKLPQKQSSSPATETAHSVSEPVLSAEHAAKKDVQANPKQEKEELTEEEKLDEMQKMMAFAHLMPTVDPWGQEITETLDVVIPYPVTFASPSKETYERAKSNFSNFVKNSSTLSTLVSMKALPGLMPKKSWRQRLWNSYQVFKTQSVEPDAIIAPFRRLALKSYEDLNMAVASRRDKDIRKFTTFQYQDHALSLAKSFRSKNPNGRNIWQLHRTLSPTQVLSIRATEGYLNDAEPRFGNRLMVHALVKFDTEQSLEIYDSRGNALHTPVEVPFMVDSDKSMESWRVPAARKRVTEYLVLERRMWIPGHWQFREQLWPTFKACELHPFFNQIRTDMLKPEF